MGIAEIIAAITLLGSMIGLYVKMQVDNATIKAEITQLKKEVDEDKQDKKEFTNALNAMQGTLHNLDKTISSMKVMIRYKHD